MKLVQLTYSMRCVPGDTEESAVLQGGMHIGTWAFPAASLKTDAVLAGLKATWVDPILKAKKAGNFGGWENLRLKALKQVRSVLLATEKQTLPEGALQMVEPLEHGHLSITHSITITLIG